MSIVTFRLSAVKVHIVSVCFVLVRSLSGVVAGVDASGHVCLTCQLLRSFVKIQTAKSLFT